jgi:hypothetical protein
MYKLKLNLIIKNVKKDVKLYYTLNQHNKYANLNI